MQTLRHNWPAVLVACAIAVLAVVLAFRSPVTVEGSTARGSEYQGTTTGQSITTNAINDTLLQNGGGTFGSVIITGAASGVVTFYDATTSNSSLRASSMSSSSIMLASFPASTAAGTYTFDRILFNGLFVHIDGAAPTTTITFRQ